MREPRFGRPAGPHKGTNRSERGDDERQAVADQDPPWMRFPEEGVWINPANDEAWGGEVEIVTSREEYDRRRAEGAPTIDEVARDDRP